MLRTRIPVAPLMAQLIKRLTRVSPSYMLQDNASQNVTFVSYEFFKYSAEMP